MSDLNDRPNSYPPSEDYLTSLGAVTANFNQLEQVLRGIIIVIDKNQIDTINLVFQKLDNGVRLQYLKSLGATFALGPIGQQLLDDFCKGYDACNHNRNMLAHANFKWNNPVAHALKAPVEATKFTKSGAVQLLTYDKDEIQQTANQINEWYEFGYKIFMWLLAQIYPLSSQSVPLPDTPLVPIKKEGSLNKAPQEFPLRPKPLTE